MGHESGAVGRLDAQYDSAPHNPDFAKSWRFRLCAGKLVLMLPTPRGRSGPIGSGP